MALLPYIKFKDDPRINLPLLYTLSKLGWHNTWNIIESDIGRLRYPFNNQLRDFIKLVRDEAERKETAERAELALQREMEPRERHFITL